MLKNTRSHRKLTTYTVIVDHPTPGDEPTAAEIHAAAHMHASNVHKVITTLGHGGDGLVVALKKGIVSVRFLVSVTNDEAAAQLHGFITEAMCADTMVRMVVGESVLGLHDPVLMPAS